jgi:hypothetical protein
MFIAVDSWQIHKNYKSKQLMRIKRFYIVLQALLYVVPAINFIDR